MKRNDVHQVAVGLQELAHPIAARAVLGIDCGVAGPLVQFRTDQHDGGIGCLHGLSKFTPFLVEIGRVPLLAIVAVLIDAWLVADRPVADIVALLLVGIADQRDGLLRRAAGQTHVDVRLCAHFARQSDERVDLIRFEIVRVAPFPARVAEQGKTRLLGQRQRFRPDRHPRAVVRAVDQRVDRPQALAGVDCQHTGDCGWRWGPGWQGGRRRRSSRCRRGWLRCGCGRRQGRHRRHSRGHRCCQHWRSAASC